MLKKYPCTMQHDQSDCAAAVVSTVLLSYKKELSIMKIREIIGTDMYGTTVSGIVSGLNKLNFTVKAVRVALEDLTPKLTFPAILQVKNDLGQNHFVVLHSIKRNSKFYVAYARCQVTNWEKFIKVLLFLWFQIRILKEGN